MLQLGFWLGEASMAAALQIPFLVKTAVSSPVHLLVFRSIVLDQGAARVTACTVLLSLAGGLHFGSAASFLEAGRKPWDIATIWELPACELLSVAAAWDLCAPEWPALQQVAVLAWAAWQPAFPSFLRPAPYNPAVRQNVAAASVDTQIARVQAGVDDLDSSPPAKMETDAGTPLEELQRAELLTTARSTAAQAPPSASDPPQAAPARSC